MARKFLTNCKECGTGFETSADNKKYCSDRCRDGYNIKNQRVTRDIKRLNKTAKGVYHMLSALEKRMTKTIEISEVMLEKSIQANIKMFDVLEAYKDLIITRESI